METNVGVEKCGSGKCGTNFFFKNLFFLKGKIKFFECPSFVINGNRYLIPLCEKNLNLLIDKTIIKD